MTVDEYDVPWRIFGSHSEDFFPLLGRIVAISAVIERDVRTLATRLDRGTGSTSKNPIGDVLKEAMACLSSIADGKQRAAVSSYLDVAGECIRRRNAYVHSLWPSVALGSGPIAVGWKPEPWPGKLALGADLEVLRDDVRRFAQLATRWSDEIVDIYNQLPEPPAGVPS